MSALLSRCREFLTVSRFTVAVSATTITLSGLLLVASLPESVLSRFPRLQKILDIIGQEHLASETSLDLMGGYYQDLFSYSDRASTANRLIGGAWTANWKRWQALQIKGHERRRDDFLYYELRPSLETVEFGTRFVTNSLGMADEEYEFSKAPGVRRIAFLGDSVLRGLGTDHGTNFEALFEDYLNDAWLSDEVRRFDVLNFGVEGYRLTQFVEVALTKAAAFDPDVYVIFLTDLSIFRKWGDHVAQLVHDGIDLKYPYLIELVREADLRADDAPATLEAKLAPYRLRVLRWALSEIGRFAASRGATTLVVLLPQVSDPDLVRESFDGVAGVVADAGISLVDLLDTFEDLNLDDYRISTFNHHPTESGHRLLYETLRARLEADSSAFARVVGRAASNAG